MINKVDKPIEEDSIGWEEMPKNEYYYIDRDIEEVYEPIHVNKIGNICFGILIILLSPILLVGFCIDETRNKKPKELLKQCGDKSLKKKN